MAATSAATCAAGAALILLFLSALLPCSTAAAFHGGGSRPRRQLKENKVASIVTEAIYNQFLQHHNDPACTGSNFFNYSAFVQATETFPQFGTTGSTAARKRELAAFFGQTSHETTGGWPTAPDGPYAWGYCFKEELDQSSDYCQASTEWPCVAGQKYFGRGPIQLSWNYNYGPAGQRLGFDGLGNPGLVSLDPVVSFQTALWFWMTPQSPKPSAHDVITGKYKPTAADKAANRLPGYGLITNIINGGLECGPANNAGGVENTYQTDRIGFYQRYTGILGVDEGPCLDCTSQTSF